MEVSPNTSLRKRVLRISKKQRLMKNRQLTRRRKSRPEQQSS
uniref:Uncharacterized protein n=1 Tax=Arundo donax TaxID=35708 RepID=A0A0A9FJV5_ARUDO